MDQRVGFCTRPDGVRIAYAVAGTGPPLVHAGPWIPVEHSWADRIHRAFLESLAAGRTLVRWDKHGTGLSDLDRTEFSVDGEVADLEAVVDHLGLQSFVLFGCSGEGPLAIVYAARHPERVERLILCNTFADGSKVGSTEVRESMLSLIRAHWGLGTKVLADVFGAGDEEATRFFGDEKLAGWATPDMTANLFQLVYDTDVRDLLPLVRAPTLVMHRDRDRAIPFESGREVAAGIPGARFVRLEGRVNDPAFGDSAAVVNAVREFLGDPVAAAPTKLLRDRYEPLEAVGQGTQGQVLRARDHQHDRLVALKVRPASSAVLEEARVLLSLRPHANLPLVRDDFFDGDRYVIVMDWADGSDLATLLQRQGDPGLPVASVLGWLEQAASALDHLHEHDPPVVHGDVKPANLVLTAGGRVLLVDFGVAGQSREPYATSGFVAPEGIAGTPADVYALAATALTLLTGGTDTIAEAAPERVRSLLRAIERGMADDPARRPRTAGELVQRLRGIREGDLPTGTVTFLLTDIEGSSASWERNPVVMARAIARHDELVEDAVDAHGGRLIKSKGEGDSTLSVFSRATDALAAALAVQRAISSEPWPADAPLRVRAGVHTGEAELRDGDYYGPTVNRAARVRSLASGGEVLVSESTAQLSADRSAGTLDDLGPRELRGMARPERVYLLRDAPTEPAAPKAAHNLPPSRTTFVGRAREIDEAIALLVERRLVTLTGPGGAGKTRLSLEVASRVLGDFPDGAWFVDLAPLADPSLVAQAACTAVGLPDMPGRSPADVLAQKLRDKRALFVVDNCEHLLDASADLCVRLLSSCPSVRVLATSREILDVEGEATLRVPPLSIDTEAVDLFVQRAASGFEVTDANQASVTQICRRLDGQPLAIELAAARTRSLGVADIAARLDESFAVLGHRGRDGTPRQRTLEATISWSYDLLDAEEQAVFRRLSVFAGGFDLDAAEVVCERDVVDLVAVLVDKSLVVAETDEAGATRYRMLETLRQFGRGRLDESGETASAMKGLVAWAVPLVFANRPPPGMYPGPIIRRETDNLRAAVAWAVDSGDVDSALRVVGYTQVGAHAEYAPSLDRVIALAEDADAELRMRALFQRGGVAFRTGDWGVAPGLFVEVVALATQLGDPWFEAMARGYGGMSAWGGGDRDAAVTGLDAAIAIAREAKIPDVLGRMLMGRAYVELDLGELDAVIVSADEVIGLSRAHADVFNLVHALESRALAAFVAGNDAPVSGLMSETLGLYRTRMIDPGCCAHCLEAAAAVVAGRGERIAAAELLGAAATQRAAAGDAGRPWERQARERTTSISEARSTDAAIASAWASGGRLSYDEAIERALDALRA